MRVSPNRERSTAITSRRGRKRFQVRANEIAGAEAIPAVEQGSKLRFRFSVGASDEFKCQQLRACTMREMHVGAF